MEEFPMKRQSLGRVLLCLLIMASGGFSMANSEGRDAGRARELWESVIAAKGGRERLYAVNNLAVSTRARYKQPRKNFTGHHYERLFVLPDKWWFWADESGFGLSIWTYDFGRQVGQEVLDIAPVARIIKPLPESAKAEAGSEEAKMDDRYHFVKRQFAEQQLLFLMETKWLQPTLIGARVARLKGKEVDVIEASYGKETFEYFIDRDTHLPLKVDTRTRMKYTQGEYEDSFVLGDYVEVQGIKFPRVAGRGGADTETTYQVNVAYDAGIFQRPPTIDMGPEAWRSSQRQ
jgi:hypothetical protein